MGGIQWQIVRTRWGDLEVNARDRSHPEGFMETGQYWPVETEALRNVIEPGWTVVDVGANLGYHSLMFSRLVGESGKVIAFEPDPDLAALFRRNMEVNGVQGRVHMREQALGARDGEVELWRSHTNHACYSLVKANVPNVGDSLQVKISRLDSVASRLALAESVDLIKIDCEGLEADVILGGAETITASRPVLWFEFWPAGLRTAQREPAQLLQWLISRGYRLDAYDLMTGSSWHVGADTAEQLVTYCDRSTEEFIKAGMETYYGIAYILATPRH